MTSVTSGRGEGGEDAAAVSLLLLDLVVVAMVQLYYCDDLFASVAFIEAEMDFSFNLSHGLNSSS